MKKLNIVKFIYSEKATKFCEISTVDLSYVVPVKSTVEISQNFMAFSEYINFILVLYDEAKWLISSSDSFDMESFAHKKYFQCL